MPRYRSTNSQYATSALCTHYGAPLEKGILDPTSGRVVCPWHGACFSVCTGDIEDAPGLDALWNYEAKVSDDGSKILVTANVEQVMSKVGRSPLVAGKGAKRGKSTTISQAASSDAKSSSKVVIVGGGSGGLHTIESLREHGFPGSITLISREPHAPIDRTKLSKALVTDVEKLVFRSEEELKTKYGVELLLGTSVTGVDTDKKQVTTTGKGDQAATVSYDHLVLVPGGDPKRLPIDGANLEKVFTLRGIQDAQQIVAQVNENARVAIIGTSFIGMEVAGAIAGKKPKSVDIIGMDAVPFTAILGEELGRALQAKVASQGVTFHMEASVERIEASKDDPKAVGAVVTKQGRIECDVLILGTGVGPATGFLKNAQGIELNKDQSVNVDEYMNVKGLENVWAAGDIATYPSLGGNDSHEMRRVEHWNLAGDQGRVIGQNIATPDDRKKYTRAPYFWSSVGGGLRYVGNSSSKPDDIHIDGKLGVDDLSFVAYFGSKGQPFAVASIKKDPYVSKASELFRLGQMPSMDELKQGKNILEIELKGKIGN